MTSVNELLICTSILKNFNLNQHQRMPLPLVIVVTGENADVPKVVSIRACGKKKQFQFKIVGSYFICHPLILNGTKTQSWFEHKPWLALTLIYLYKPTTYKSGVLFNEYKYCKPSYLYEH